MNDDDKKRVRDGANLDQAMALLGDTIPPALFSFYANCLKAGFDDDNAMVLTMEVMRKMLGSAE